MDLSNLATVICPSILYAKGQTAERDESFAAIRAVESLLEAQDDIYHVPPELLFVIHENVASIFTREVDLPPKEIHKHCAKYLQARHVPPQSRGQGRGDQQRPPDLRLSGYPDNNNHGHGREREREHRDREREREAQSDREQQRRDPRDDAAHRGVFPAGGNNSRPTSWAATPGNSTPATGSSGPPTGLIAMPTPHINGLSSPSYSHSSTLQQPLPSPSWRGPFQGQGTSSGSNGSRHSSRGSAPPSPAFGAEGERRSFQMERDASRERAWTPNDTRHA